MHECKIKNTQFFHRIKYDLKGRSHNKVIYQPTMIQFLVNTNIMKTQNLKVALNHLYIIERLQAFFTFRTSNLITTLTYFLTDNFCPCLRCKLEIPSILQKDRSQISHLVIYSTFATYVYSKLVNR